MKSFVPFVVAVVGLATAGLGTAAPTLSASAGGSWAGNITRSPDPDAVKDALLYDGNAAAAWHEQLSRDFSLEYGLNGGFELCPKYDGLDRFLAGLQISLREKFGLGPLAPALRAEVSYAGDWYRESLHTGTRLTAGLSLSKRWTDSWQTVLGAEYLANDGHAACYDFHNRGLSLESHYDLSETWQLTAGVRRQWGEQVTYAWLGGSGADFPYNYDAWKNTTEIPTYGRNWYGYTLDAHADTVWIALSPALGRNRALPLRYEHTAVIGRGESYQSRLISLTFVQRF